jgi:hypothetical protein
MFSYRCPETVDFRENVCSNPNEQCVDDPTAYTITSSVSFQCCSGSRRQKLESIRCTRSPDDPDGRDCHVMIFKRPVPCWGWDFKWFPVSCAANSVRPNTSFDTTIVDCNFFFFVGWKYIPKNFNHVLTAVIITDTFLVFFNRVTEVPRWTGYRGFYDGVVKGFKQL